MFKLILSLLILTQLVACGGGSGGGGVGSRPNTGVRLLHAGIDISPLELISSTDTSSASLPAVKFADASAYLALDTGAQSIALRRANTSEVIEQLNLEVKKGELRTIIIAGSRAQSNGVSVQASLGAIPELDSATSAVRVAHGAFGAATINATINSSTLPQAVGFTGVSDYQIVPAGNVSASVTRSADGALLYSGSFSAQARGSYTIFVAGEVGYYIKTTVLTD